MLAVFMLLNGVALGSLDGGEYDIIITSFLLVPCDNRAPHTNSGHDYFSSLGPVQCTCTHGRGWKEGKGGPGTSR